MYYRGKETRVMDEDTLAKLKKFTNVIDEFLETDKGKKYVG
jgi:hypothetical protein